MANMQSFLLKTKGESQESCLTKETDFGEPADRGTRTDRHDPYCMVHLRNQVPALLSPEGLTGVVPLAFQMPNLPVVRTQAGMADFLKSETNCLDTWKWWLQG